MHKLKIAMILVNEGNLHRIGKISHDNKVDEFFSYLLSGKSALENLLIQILNQNFLTG